MNDLAHLTLETASSKALQTIFLDSSLLQLDNLQLEFKFDSHFNYDEGDYYEKGKNSVALEDATDEDLLEKETGSGWRPKYAAILGLLARNTTIQHLKLVNIPPKDTIVFNTHEWRTALARLDSLDLSVWGGDNGAGWHANTMPEYNDTIECLRWRFFEHLDNVRRLTFRAHAGNPIGCSGMRHMPTLLHDGVCPKLEHLELEYHFIDPVLQEFLVRKARQLKSLHLVGCLSAWCEDFGGLAEDGITWEEFFNAIIAAKPALEQLVVSSNSALPGLSIKGKDHVLVYKTLDDKYGMVFENEEVDAERADDGKDLDSYNRLMELMTANRANLGLPPFDLQVSLDPYPRPVGLGC